MTIWQAYDKIKACKKDCATCPKCSVKMCGSAYSHLCAIADAGGMCIYSDRKSDLKAETIKAIEWELNISRHDCNHCPKHSKPTCQKCPIF